MKIHIAGLAFAFLVVCSLACAQALPDMPESKLTSAAAEESAPIHRALPEHSFFDLKNSFAMGSFAVALAGDAYSTQQGIARGYTELNPIARLFVKSRAGEVIYSAGSFGLLAGGMYLAHKTGHHRLERIVPFGLSAWEGFMTFRNFHVISRPRTAP